MRTVKDYKNLNMEKLKYDIESTPWQLMALFEDPDDVTWCWDFLLQRTLNDHIKSRKVKIKSNSNPWMNGEI